MSLIKVFPSILSADFAKLAEEVEKVSEAGADVIHLDIMDGHFVPNLTFGPPVVSKLAKYCKIPMDAHLMVEDPELYLEGLAKANVGSVSFHIESRVHHHRVIQRIKSLGMKAGIALNPGTSLSSIDAISSHLDYILIMTVNPGFGGQSFIESQIEKIKAARKLNIPIQVDGGVKDSTLKSVIDAGATWLVAGSFIFGHKDGYKAAIRHLKQS